MTVYVFRTPTIAEIISRLPFTFQFPEQVISAYGRKEMRLDIGSNILNAGQIASLETFMERAGFGLLVEIIG